MGLLGAKVSCKDVQGYHFVLYTIVRMGGVFCARYRSASRNFLRARATVKKARGAQR